jgi:hypothetical protein
MRTDFGSRRLSLVLELLPCVERFAEPPSAQRALP